MNNSKKIIDYSEYRTESIYWDSKNQYLFFEKIGFCPNCQKKAQVVFEDHDEFIVDDDSAACHYYSVTVHQCSCGWWDLHDHENTGSDSVDPCLDWDTAYRGILKTFDIDDLDLPVSVLSNEIIKNPGNMDHIHSTKMEDLVHQVLIDFFPGCTVEKFGRGVTHDGGFDGYMILHEKKFGLQIKRRQPKNINKGEPVNLIRELVGAMITNRVPDSLYFTNATHFSCHSIKAAKDALMAKDINTIQLIDRDRLFGMLELYSDKHSEEWIKLLPNYAKKRI